MTVHMKFIWASEYSEGLAQFASNYVCMCIPVRILSEMHVSVKVFFKQSISFACKGLFYIRVSNDCGVVGQVGLLTFD